MSLHGLLVKRSWEKINHEISDLCGDHYLYLILHEMVRHRKVTRVNYYIYRFSSVYKK
jgi:hypothetical protein